MLQVQNIYKKYVTGELTQQALDGVSLNFRDNEFVAILGPSGSGKTTLLNIIGGLDRYDEGNVIINGVSTKAYKDRDWDSYRNHTVGFVFQSYNLIPHQSVLANVELALTIAGVSKSERRKRATQALEKVGLGDQLHKKPNQMSGGQMQRVAIARALVNDPDILLADEPTGALDSATGRQVMDLLKSVADDRLVVMVSHNSELAAQYATRMVRLHDGKITADSDPYEPEQSLQPPIHKNMGKARMSWFTSLALSANNLRTKKGRTLLTAFAGSIGIIGIALILSLSTGVNDYIDSIQKDTMTSYPITLSAQTLDLSAMEGMRGQMIGGMRSEASTQKTGIYADNRALEISERISGSIAQNDLTAFRKYLNDPSSEINQYIGENGVVYSYHVNFSIYSYDADGTLVNSSADTDDVTGSTSTGFGMDGMNGMNFLMGSGSQGAENFTELMKGSSGEPVSAVLTDSYEVLYGTWPQAYDEVVLILDTQNSISSSVLYQLGLITADTYKALSDAILEGDEPDDIRFDYAEVCKHTFYMVPACDMYRENIDTVFTYLGDTAMQEEDLLKNAVELKIVGVVRPVGDDANAYVSETVGYSSALTDYVVEHTNDSAVVLAQEAEPERNVLTGMAFEAADDAQKVSDAIAYIKTMKLSDKASLYQLILLRTSFDGSNASGYAAATDEASMAAMLDAWLENTPDEEILVSLYDEYIAGSSYEDNMTSFGKVSYDAPSSISIYTDSFEDKDAVADCITAYNETVDEDSRITYTDYVALITSSITSIINVISYVLIAFVAVSLVVSCIMIGIITHISVLERTKEIGILRALGASKRNISQVFNAETFIIGLAAGVLGVAISALLTIPINAIIAALVGSEAVRAVLSVGYAVILVGISMLITILGGLLPARKAAKKDPVIALRTE